MSPAMSQLYDHLGRDYGDFRRPDPRLAAAILHALGDSAPVVNVGAGAGSYEPIDREVLAIEPSATMVRQRPREGAPVVRASATHLPLRDGAFAAALAVLTVHHWPDRERGLRELARVARQRVVILNHDPLAAPFWLVDDYFPEIREIDRGIFPTLAEFESALGPVTVTPLPIPHDCTDGFLGAYWRRPQAYLDPGVRHAISTFARVTDVEAGLARLRADLDSGAWDLRHGHLRERAALDLGYRLVTARMVGAADV